ncbi:FAD-binding oxidoreductase [Parapedomonas caeni]
MADIDTFDHGLAALKAIVGDGGWLDQPGDMAPFARDWRGGYDGVAALVVKPRSVDQVVELVKCANKYRIGLVPQGGNTGLVLAGIPDQSGRQVVVSLERLNRIRAVDADDFSLVAEAGVILTQVQEAAEAVDRLFPLSLGSQGSARIGGLVSTNAGGVHVLRYGSMRALVLGVEAVLPNGEVFHGLTPLRKDNTGYDLKQLLVGGEGTLGIVTAVTLKLFPRPRDVVTAWVALDDPDKAVGLLAHLRAATGDQVCAFEMIPRIGVDLTLQHIPDTRDPLPGTPSPWVVLTEMSSTRADSGLREVAEAALAEAFERGLARDAVLAESQAQGQAMWKIRETLPLAERMDGIGLHHDISVSVARMPAYITEGTAALEALMPGVRVIAFGHLGDGNIHFSVHGPLGMTPAEFYGRAREISACVYELVLKYGGSISAEHGIGMEKREQLAATADPAKLWALRAIKTALDPNGIMNPGKVV